MDVQNRYKIIVQTFCCNIDPFTLDIKKCVDPLPRNDGYFDLVNYCIEKDSSYTQESFKAYKSLEAFKFFESGWVQKISCRNLNDGSLLFLQLRRLRTQQTHNVTLTFYDGKQHATEMARFGNLNPYDIHKRLINEYLLKKPGDTKGLIRDTSKDRTDLDVIRENHRFLWDDDDEDSDSWEKQLAKRYYDKLFKEYCICDLSRYKENKVAMRWRIENEVITGKGQFICGNRICSSNLELRSWEVNFGYDEHGVRKNALIKLRLCPECSKKLNYHNHKREVKKLKKERKKRGKSKGKADTMTTSSPSCSSSTVASKSISDDEQIPDSDVHDPEKQVTALEQQCWTKPLDVEDKSREEEFDDYLEDLLL